MQQPMLDADALAAELAADDLPTQEADVARLSSKLLELDEEHRIVLCLHFFERLSLQEIAALLDDTEASVREVFVEAIARISDQIERRRDAA